MLKLANTVLILINPSPSNAKHLAKPTMLMCETRLLELALPKSFHCANLDDGSVSGTVLISKENIHTKKGDPLIMEMRSSIIKC